MTDLQATPRTRPLPEFTYDELLEAMARMQPAIYYLIAPAAYAFAGIAKVETPGNNPSGWSWIIPQDQLEAVAKMAEENAVPDRST